MSCKQINIIMKPLEIVLYELEENKKRQVSLVLQFLM